MKKTGFIFYCVCLFCFLATTAYLVEAGQWEELAKLMCFVVGGFLLLHFEVDTLVWRYKKLWRKERKGDLCAQALKDALQHKEKTEDRKNIIGIFGVEDAADIMTLVNFVFHWEYEKYGIQDTSVWEYGCLKFGSTYIRVYVTSSNREFLKKMQDSIKTKSNN